MKLYAVPFLILVSSLFAFGTPSVPDVPDVEVPDVEIPGLDLLDGVQGDLDELVTSTDSLVWLIPELSTLNEVSAKLEELRETDPDIIGLQERIDSLRSELEVARSKIEEISDVINGKIQSVRSSIDTFLDGLPIPAN